MTGEQLPPRRTFGGNFLLDVDRGAKDVQACRGFSARAWFRPMDAILDETNKAIEQMGHDSLRKPMVVSLV